MNYQDEPQWLKTIDAARALGLSTQTMMRYRDDQGGFLAVGYDYQFGMHPNSPIRWNVPAIRKALHKRGLEAKILARRANQELQKTRVEA
tara:strand:+ start:323 stop:592 length:270 start_codon:yes stop_codon:yes gene_type:complete